MIRAVFFDVANTLLQKRELLPRMRDTLEKAGVKISLEYLAMRHKLVTESMVFPDKTSLEFYNHFNAELLLALGVVPSASLTESLFEACTYLPWSAFDDCDALGQIDLPKGVLSNWDSTLEEKLSQHINVSFDWILGSSAQGVQKPNPAFFQSMITATGFHAEEILFVGDSMRLDIAPAQACGVQAVLIDRHDLYAEASVNRIRSLHQIIELL